MKLPIAALISLFAFMAIPLAAQAAGSTISIPLTESKGMFYLRLVNDPKSGKVNLDCLNDPSKSSVLPNPKAGYEALSIMQAGNYYDVKVSGFDQKTVNFLILDYDATQEKEADGSMPALQLEATIKGNRIVGWNAVRLTNTRFTSNQKVDPERLRQFLSVSNMKVGHLFPAAGATIRKLKGDQ